MPSCLPAVGPGGATRVAPETEGDRRGRARRGEQSREKISLRPRAEGAQRRHEDGSREASLGGRAGLGPGRKPSPVGLTGQPRGRPSKSSVSDAPSQWARRMRGGPEARPMSEVKMRPRGCFCGQRGAAWRGTGAGELGPQGSAQLGSRIGDAIETK